MQRYQPKKKTISRIISSRVVLAALAVIALLILSSSYELYKKKKRVALLRDQAKKEFLHIEQKTGELDIDINKITSPHGREKAMRLKYNIKKEGEQVIVVTKSGDEKPEPVVKKGVFDSVTDGLSKLFD
jgi:hypothetical protein